MTRITAMLICVALTGCVDGSPRNSQAIEPGASVTLGVGEKASLEGTAVSLRFVGVIEDSRCPSDTTCVWAGEVKAEIEILERSKASRSVALKISENTNVAGRVVTLERVEPQPMSTVRMAASGYRATLKIE